MTGFEHYSRPAALSITGGSGGGLTTFARCPRKFFYSAGVRITAAKHVALQFGEAMHAALPHAFFDDLPLAFATFARVFDGALPDDKRNMAQAVLMLTDYRDSHADGRSIYTLVAPPTNIPKVNDRVSDYELPFALDIGLQVPFIGRVDGLVQHRDTGELWGLEWKTTSEMSSRFFDGFQLNPQVLGYTLALRSYGLAVKGMFVEGIKVSLAKQKAQETLCQPIYVSDYQLEDFIIWARMIGNQIRACEELKQFPKDISACTPYSQHGSPGFQCEFMNMCQVPQWESLLSMYEKRDARPSAVDLTPITIGATS